MAATSERTICFSCNKEKLTYLCGGCSQRYCVQDLVKHRTDLSRELDQIQNDHDQFRQNLNDHKSNPSAHPLIEQINRWEINAIEKIRRTAEECRKKYFDHSNGFLLEIETKLTNLAQQIQQMHREDEFNEIDLNHLKQRLNNLQNELRRPANVLIKEHSTSFINNISLRLPLHTGRKKRKRFSSNYSSFFSSALLRMVFRSSSRHSMETSCNNDRRWEWSGKSMWLTL